MAAVFLDLDGTLMDSRPGIMATLKTAFQETGLPEHAEGDLTWMIGPPFQDTFERLGIENPGAVIEAYRRHYEAGAMFDATVFDGILPMLNSLLAQGHRLYLATAKPHVAACKITRHFGLSSFMTAEFGPELDGTRNWKGDLLAYALQQTGETAENSVMVGDRHHDVAAGAFVGMATVAVRWGYGTPADWEEASVIIDHPVELPGAIQSLGL